MDNVKELEARRDAVLEQMRSMRSMRRGTITEQYLKVKHKGKKEPVLRGPYYVFARWEGTKTASKRLRSPAELERAREDVDAYKRYVQLCKQFEELSERLGELEHRSEDVDAQKKTPKSRLSRTRK